MIISCIFYITCQPVLWNEERFHCFNLNFITQLSVKLIGKIISNIAVDGSCTVLLKHTIDLFYSRYFVLIQKYTTKEKNNPRKTPAAVFHCVQVFRAHLYNEPQFSFITKSHLHQFMLLLLLTLWLFFICYVMLHILINR